MSTHQAIGRRAGLTLVELLLVVVIVSILAGLAIPNYQNVVTKARAADLLGRIDVVEVAVQSYLGDNNAWPGETGTGVIPTGIVSYLPAGELQLHGGGLPARLGERRRPHRGRNRDRQPAARKCAGGPRRPRPLVRVRQPVRVHPRAELIRPSPLGPPGSHARTRASAARS
jgi:prepilin-type N-terminal cleavage/methylation domain-containing protein